MILIVNCIYNMYVFCSVCACARFCNAIIMHCGKNCVVVLVHVLRGRLMKIIEILTHFNYFHYFSKLNI